MCFDIEALFSITIKKSLTTPTNSGKPTFPEPLFEAVFKALSISKILLPYGSNSISASFNKSLTQ